MRRAGAKRRSMHTGRGAPDPAAPVTRREFLLLGLGLGGSLAGCAGLPIGPGEPPKRLIAFSGGEPSTSFLRRHIRQMEETPFDGCVFHATYTRPDGRPGNFTWEAWGARAVSPAQLRDATADLQALRLRRFTHNFLRLNVTPGTLDWFDDFGPIAQNARLAAELARVGGAAGILLDTEAYQRPLFDFRRQARTGASPWEAYAAQARRRGRQVMEAFQEGYPDLTLLLTFGYSAPWLELSRGARGLPECEYGLLAPFLDGMLEGSRGASRLVDGFEPAYFHDKDTAKIGAAPRLIRETLLPIVADPVRYRQRLSVGIGLFLDYDPAGRPWDGADGSRNYYTPADFETSVRAALQAADELVWIYTDTPRWWSEAGGTVALPAGYLEALRRARDSLPRAGVSPACPCA